MATLNLDMSGCPDFGPEKFKKFLQENTSDCPPHLTNKFTKYIYSKGSHGVFRGTQYIGQGKLQDNSLIVDVHYDINSWHMKQKDHFALFRNNN